MQRYLSYAPSYDVNDEAFAAFFHRQYASLCFFANRYVNDPAVAEDIVADVALKIWEKKGELRSAAALKSYFYTSLRNACLDWITKEKNSNNRAREYQLLSAGNEEPITENIIRAETFHELELAIDTLPPQCRKVVVKLFLEGKSLSEVAEEMQLSINTIKNQRQRGIQLLRQRLTAVSMLYLLAAGFL